jgi:hypothetical protein
MSSLVWKKANTHIIITILSLAWIGHNTHAYDATHRQNVLTTVHTSSVDYFKKYGCTSSLTWLRQIRFAGSNHSFVLHTAVLVSIVFQNIE